MVDQIPPFDFSLLSTFFAAGGGMSQSLRTEVLRKGALSDILNKPSVIPPWEIKTTTDNENINELAKRAVSPGPTIDKNDPLFDRNDLDDDSKVLFATFKALNRLKDMADFIQTNKGEPLGTILDAQFQKMVTELREFIDTAQYNRLSLDLGILTDKVNSLITLDQVERAPVFLGAAILDDLTNPISGINTTDQFTIQSEDINGTVRTVTITMSDISANVNDYTLPNIVNHINTKLTDAGIASSFIIERHTESKFGLRVAIGFDETVTLSTPNATHSEAVYVSGVRGGSRDGGGYLAKIDNLAAGDPNQVFFRQIDTLNNDGSGAADRAEDVAVDSNGYVYVVGSTEGDLGNQKVDPIAKDIFLQKYDSAGNLLFTRRLGAPVDGSAFSVKVDSNDNVFVSGQVQGILTENGHGGGYDTFVTKFDKNGLELFTRQAAPFANDGALSMSLDSDNNVFLAGFTQSEIAPGEGFGGNTDAFITKLDNSGNLLYDRQLGGRNPGPDASEENIDAIAIAPNGDIWVSGEDDESIFISHYEEGNNGNRTVHVIGNAGEDKITDLAVDANGDVYGTGFSSVAFLSPVVQAKQNGLDAFVFQLGQNGQFVYRTFIGTAADDKAFGIDVNPNTGEAYVAGTTEGTLAGETNSTKKDNFVVKLNANGSEAWRHQFGGGFDSNATGISYDSNGTNLLSRFGLPTGKVPPDSSDLVTAVTSARAGDYFYISINDGPHERILIEEDDTFGFLAFKIRKAFGTGVGTKGVASFIDDDLSGRFLQIQALNGNKVELIKGSDEFDALKALGFSEKTLYGEIKDDGTEGFVQTAFGLGFINEMSIETKEKAEDVRTLIDFAELTVKKAFRLLTEGPDPEFKLPNRAPQRILDQIASMQSALQRLQSATASANSSLLGTSNSIAGNIGNIISQNNFLV